MLPGDKRLVPAFSTYYERAMELGMASRPTRGRRRGAARRPRVQRTRRATAIRGRRRPRRRAAFAGQARATGRWRRWGCATPRRARPWRRVHVASARARADSSNSPARRPSLWGQRAAPRGLRALRGAAERPADAATASARHHTRDSCEWLSAWRRARSASRPRRGQATARDKQAAQPNRRSASRRSLKRLAVASRLARQPRPQAVPTKAAHSSFVALGHFLAAAVGWAGSTRRLTRRRRLRRPRQRPPARATCRGVFEPCRAPRARHFRRRGGAGVSHRGRRSARRRRGGGGRDGRARRGNAGALLDAGPAAVVLVLRRTGNGCTTVAVARARAREATDADFVTTMQTKCRQMQTNADFLGKIRKMTSRPSDSACKCRQMQKSKSAFVCIHNHFVCI